MTSGAVRKRYLDLTKRNPASESLYNTFEANIINQSQATQFFVDVVEKYKAGLCNPSKPAGNAIFLGPTGSGKTYVVECAAEAMFGDTRACIKIDCAEFQHSHEIAKLVGSPPGYLGHRETHPMLTQEALNQWFTADLKLAILLFDEIEKASDSLWQLLLGILDKAVLTLGDNRRVDLSQCIIVMTSNLGVADVNALLGNRLGFIPSTFTVKEEKVDNVILDAMKRKFTPEFLNRIDSTIVFKTLTPEDCRLILSKELAKALYAVHRAKSGVTFRISPEAKDAIFEEGYSVIYNARHIKRAVEKRVTLPVAKVLSSGQIRDGEKIMIGYREGKFEYFVLEGDDGKDNGILAG